MGEEPTWAELLLAFFLMAAVPAIIGGAVLFSLVGLTMWVTAPLRRRRRAQSENDSGHFVWITRQTTGDPATCRPAKWAVAVLGSERRR